MLFFWENRKAVRKIRIWNLRMVEEVRACGRYSETVGQSMWETIEFIRCDCSIACVFCFMWDVLPHLFT